MYLTQGLKRSVQIRGGEIATVDGGRRRTWAEFGERVARLAGALREQGLEPGDRVAVLAANSDRYLEAFFAVPWAGGVVVPVNIRWAPPEIADSLNDSGAVVLFVDEQFHGVADGIVGGLEGLRHVVFMADGTHPPGTVGYEDMLAAADPVADALRGGDDLAGIFYTGGTTGRAKGVMLSHANLYTNAMSTIAKLVLRSNDVYLHAAPMFHLADGLSTWAITMVGGTHVFVPGFDPGEVLWAIETHSVSYTTFVPTMLQMLLNDPSFAERDLGTLRKLFYGASPMPQPLLERALSDLPQCRFHGAYGMTELSPVATILDPEFHTLEGPGAGRLRSVGRATLGVELRVVDSEGTEAPLGTVGEIVVRGPNVMQGYWNQPEATRAALRAGWLHSGDLGYMDEEGFVYIADRLKDMICPGGENVYSAEVENAIYQHPDVLQCAVIGIPSAEWGEAVHAVIVLEAGATTGEQEIIAHCRERIAGYKCPRSIEFRTEPLPLSGAGKVLKTELRMPWWRERDGS